MMKIAYGAGHYLHEAGKRFPKELDPAETREWTVNDRVARYFAEAASQYEGVELRRTDDPTGQTEVDLQPRCDIANDFNADFAVSFHHNAGAGLTSAGGIEAYSYPGSTEGAKYRDAIYDACIAAGGLKGNRAEPKKTASYYVLKYTNMPAVLMEFGFMDSAEDYKVILQDEYSKLMAYATMEGIAKVAGLKKKSDQASSAPAPKSGPSVLEWQQAAIKDGFRFPLYGADGKWGAECESVARQAIVKRRENYLYKNLTRLVQRVVGAEQDGLCGPDTENAIIEYQKAHGLAADGCVGINTWKKILGV